MQFDCAPIIDRLELDALSVGRHYFRFRAMTNGVGHGVFLPVVVLKGCENGPKVMITAGLHGDELNGILTAQQLVRELDHVSLQGTVVIVPGLNVSGILARHRTFQPTDPECSGTDLNRVFPGKADGNSAGRYIHTIWHNLLAGNADYALELHTQTTGNTFPLFIFADFRIEAAKNMARAMGADAIFDDPGDVGVMETQWNQSGVPCITIEVGCGGLIEPALIQRAVDGIGNVLRYLSLDQTETALISQNAVEGNAFASIRSETGGMAVSNVRLGQSVKQGELLATQYDAFGHVNQQYYAPCAGYVLSTNNNALREPGTLLVRLLYSC